MVQVLVELTLTIQLILVVHLLPQSVTVVLGVDHPSQLA
jgi:hypothetical protein